MRYEAAIPVHIHTSTWAVRKNKIKKLKLGMHHYMGSALIFTGLNDIVT